MVLQILKFLFICLEVVLLFNLLILVHELGHFLAARWRGLVVEKFAIWFGKPIWKKTINGVEYRLGSIPAGGFVAIPQLAPMEALEGETENKRAKPSPGQAPRQDHRRGGRPGLQHRSGLSHGGDRVGGR